MMTMKTLEDTQVILKSMLDFVPLTDEIMEGWVRDALINAELLPTSKSGEKINVWDLVEKATPAQIANWMQMDVQRLPRIKGNLKDEGDKAVIQGIIDRRKKKGEKKGKKIRGRRIGSSPLAGQALKKKRGARQLKKKKKGEKAERKVEGLKEEAVGAVKEGKLGIRQQIKHQKEKLKTRKVRKRGKVAAERIKKRTKKRKAKFGKHKKEAEATVGGEIKDRQERQAKFKKAKTDINNNIETEIKRREKSIGIFLSKEQKNTMRINLQKDKEYNSVKIEGLEGDVTRGRADKLIGDIEKEIESRGLVKEKPKEKEVDPLQTKINERKSELSKTENTLQQELNTLKKKPASEIGDRWGLSSHHAKIAKKEKDLKFVKSNKKELDKLLIDTKKQEKKVFALQDQYNEATNEGDQDKTRAIGRQLDVEETLLNDYMNDINNESVDIEEPKEEAQTPIPTPQKYGKPQVGRFTKERKTPSGGIKGEIRVSVSNPSQSINDILNKEGDIVASHSSILDTLEEHAFTMYKERKIDQADLSVVENALENAKIKKSYDFIMEDLAVMKSIMSTPEERAEQPFKEMIDVMDITKKLLL